MSTIRTALTAAGLVAVSAAVQAQFVKGNEAVRFHADGTKTVETPPLPRIQLAAPCRADIPVCTPSGWRMVETQNGLQECTEIYARPGTCRDSTYGSEKRPRLWIVKIKGQWMQCQRPDITSVCVSTKTPPHSQVQ